MFAALWRPKLLLLFVVICLVLLSIDTARRDRQTFKALRLVGLQSVSRTTEPIFPPLTQGCPKSSNDGAEDTLTVPDGGTCFPVELLSDVQIVLKTGIAEREKTEAFLSTFGSCIPNILIFSDAEDVVAGYNVTDILADLPPSYEKDNPDWDAYASQRQALADGKPIEKSHGGWRLDRFKFLPMVDKAFELAPQAKWYVFIEADMYFFWDSLFRMLSTLDPLQPHCLGAATPGSYGRWFAYGGGGTVLSKRLMRDLLDDGQRRVSAIPQYIDWIKDDCCGDAVLAYVLHKQLGVRLENIYPTLSGESVHWLGTSKKKWCTPLVGLHRVGPEQMRQLWRWERCRPYTENPITYATILDFVLTPILETGSKKNWNNGAKDVWWPEDSEAHDSHDSCQAACAGNATCLQYSYSEGICHVADFVNGGEPLPDDSGVVAGWNLASLQELGYIPSKDPGAFCSHAKWLIPAAT